MELGRNEPARVVGSGKAREGLGLTRVCPRAEGGTPVVGSGKARERLGLTRVCPRAGVNTEVPKRACGRPTVPSVGLDESAVPYCRPSV
ncbi:hypothetical protein M513_13150 [Trichuris suis]|uniref:Uncharacterized protein n=1 Tax=Trichuris suis TaxID=68888 RepID=A0A085LLX2_9BILA|nr:hypothetical protein M513_13150 [Trichuris suis]